MHDTPEHPTRQAPTVYWIGRQSTGRALETWLIPISSLSQLPASLESPFVVIDQEGDVQDDTLRLLHRRRDAWTLMIFTLGRSALADCLGDGRPPDDWMGAALDYQDRLLQLHLDEHGMPANNLLAWLWINPTRRLQARAMPQLANLYDYPLLTLWQPDQEEASAWLGALEREGLLKQQSLVDRIRLCPECHSGHLNYLETCPECQSADIEREVALHCFTCGEVSHQARFLRGGRLQCPNCLTPLRHIGVDYDRPLETYRCRACRNGFAEPRTRVRCLDCASLFEVEAMRQRHIYHYVLGDHAPRLLRYGQKNVIAPFTVGNSVDPSFLHGVLVWFNALALRHQQRHLLLVVQLKNLRELVQSLGENQAYRLLDAASERIQQMLRNTDISCVYQVQFLLLLLPHTDRAALPALEAKFSQLADAIEDAPLALALHAWELPDPELQDAELWLSERLGQLDDE